MCIIADTTVDTQVAELFETVLPTGLVSPVFLDHERRQAVMPGTVDPHAFACEANALIALLAATVGGPKPEVIVDPASVISLPARVTMNAAAGTPDIDWCVTGDEDGLVTLTVAAV